eukprot:jgi/Chlat1/3282/Chrsp22S03534
MASAPVTPAAAETPAVTGAPELQPSSDVHTIKEKHTTAWSIYTIVVALRDLQNSTALIYSDPILTEMLPRLLVQLGLMKLFDFIIYYVGTRVLARICGWHRVTYRREVSASGVELYHDVA